MEYYLIALIMFAGASLQGITGFGSGLVAVPLLSLLIPLPQLTPLLSIINVLMALYLCWLLRHYFSLKRWRWLLLAGVGGTLVGNAALAYLPVTILQQGMAIFVIAAGLLFWFGVQFQARATALQQSYTGLLAGFANGALTLGGPPVVLFLTATRLNRSQFRATLALFFLVLGLTNVISFTLQGRYTVTGTAPVFALVFGAISGAYLGHRVSHLLPEQLFRKLTLGVVIGAGVMVLLTS
ncbi:sulfite exporter TauE/SafE family protein [Pseudidiomarina terrestris]|uniref:sulfite exporter TauE/SafE family protein n=1 Tax=Pseudidiomarina terrestris TaxID=2820060 RepID=UPI00264E9DB5|nr:sulfite exporter TauE/SafE family protein [Pseudidiomarina sp. 1ASP75-5]MDN7135060.1 sulfite exporter TauE/SafE family protein [Pseudidiomarina sp. 1ASP75-5]